MSEVANMSFNAIRENNILAKIFEFTTYMYHMPLSPVGHLTLERHTL